MKLSRRSFVKSVGALTAGAVAVGLATAGDAGTRGEVLAPPGAASSQQFAPRRDDGAAEALPANAFSIFWITDTQFLSEANPALFRMMTEWIARNWEKHQGKLVIHTGDLVQTGSDTVQWGNADEAMSILLNNSIPYTWCAGNHDDLSLNDSTSGWMGRRLATSLDPAAVGAMVNALPYAQWVGDYHDAMNTAMAFTAGGLKLLVINIEWSAEPDALAWAESILDNPLYADYRVILAPHAYIDSSGDLQQSQAEQIDTFTSGLTYLLTSYSRRVFLTLNGHFPTDCGYNTPSPVDGHNDLMFDRQDCTDGADEPTGRGADDQTSNDSDRIGGSTITILTFMPDDNKIAVKTFDLYKGGWRTGQTEQYLIDMFAYPVTTTSVHPVIGTASGTLPPLQS